MCASPDPDRRSKYQVVLMHWMLAHRKLKQTLVCSRTIALHQQWCRHGMRTVRSSR